MSTQPLAVPRLRRPQSDVWDKALFGAIVGGIALLVWALIVRNYLELLVVGLDHPWLRLAERPAFLWSSMGTLLIVFRTALWMRYRDLPTATAGEAPALTVIIPAYNEGPMVAHSIDSVARSNYPRDRLEIFVVDDGSRDDTWEHIQAAAQRYPGLVTTLRFEKNRGKRAGLEAGFRRGRGEIFVTIDSDSLIEPDALLAMVGPFTDPRVGAVAGKVIVLNREQGFLPRMLHVRFILAFDFLRAAQSGYGTVQCCPGALAGYRASVVRQVLDAWMDQKFLGVPCTYGEDRAMTNFILGAGYDTVYQRAAVVHTVVPHRYRKLTRMFIRWDRSYIREQVRLIKIVWRRPLAQRLIALFDIAVTNLRFPVSYVSLGFLILFTIHTPLALVRVLIAIGLMSLFNVLYYLKSERSYDFLYGVLYAYYAFFFLWWIFPCALVTVRSKSWMTR